MIEIRLPRSADAPACAELAALVIGPDRAGPFIKSHLEQHQLMVAEAGGEIVGFLAYRTDWFQCTFVTLVVVREDWRRRGIAREFYRSVEVDAAATEFFESGEYVFRWSTKERRDSAGTIHAVQRTLAWSAAFAACFSLAYAVAGESLIGLLTSMPAVRSAASEYLPWLVALPLVSVWSFLYDGVFVGATRPREMRAVMMASAVLVFLPVWYLARGLGNHGLWLHFTLFMAARGIGMHAWFRRMLARGVFAS